MKLSQKIAVIYTRAYFYFLALVSPEKAARQALIVFCTPRRKYRHTPSTLAKEAESLSFKMDNLNIRGHRWNHPSHLKVLIIHGFGSAAANFEGYVLPLVNKGYEVVAFDAPGHGKSDGSELYLPVYVQMLQHIVSKYGPFNSYIAHSFGGLAITHLLETIVHDEQTKLVLIAPATETTSAINHFFQLIPLPKKARTAFNRLITEKTGSSPDFLSIQRSVRHIRARLLWLHDRLDDITPYSDAEKVMNDHHPNIQFIVSSGLGHRKIYRNKESLDHILHFL